MAVTVDSVFRDDDIDGVPASGPHEPAKEEIRELLGGMEAAIDAFLANGGYVYATRALLFVDLAHDANSMAWVISDTTIANNGIYQKSGASGAGSWTRVADLPYSFVRASDVGAGTPNAIVATSALPISDNILVAFVVHEANTSSPVTISFNGATALTIKTAAGNDVAAAGLPAGMAVIGYRRGSNFRLLSDQASAAIQSAAEAALADAETARDLAIAAADLAATVGAGDVPTYPSRALAAAATIPGARTWLFCAGRDNPGDGGHAYFKEVVSEPAHGAFFESADGAFWEIFGPTLRPEQLDADHNTAFSIAAAALAGGYYTRLALSGEYTLDSATRFDINGAPGPIQIEGDGYAKIFFDEGTSARPFVIRNMTGVTVRGIEFENLDQANPNNCLDVVNCSEVFVENSVFDGATVYGLVVADDVIAISTAGSSQSGTHKFVYDEGASEITVTISAADPAVLTAAGHGFSYGERGQLTTTGLLPESFAESVDYQVASTPDADTFTLAVAPVACDNVTVRHNTFKNCGQIGFTQFPKVKSTTTEIYGNRFFDCGANPTGAGGSLSAMKPGQSYENAKVYGNIIYNTAGGGNVVGIAMGNWESMEVYDNQIYDPDSYGIVATMQLHSLYTAEYKSLILRNNQVLHRAGVTATEPDIVINGDYTGGGQVIIDGNVLTRSYRGVSVRVSAAIPNIEIKRNTINELVGAEWIYIDNTGGSAPSRVVIEDNVCINNDLAATAKRIYILGAASPVLRGNRILRAGNNAVLFESCSGTILVERNDIIGYNVANTAGVAAINAQDSGANTYLLIGNNIITGQGNPKAVYNGNNATPTVVLADNLTDDTTVQMTINATPTVLTDGAKPFAQYGRCRQFGATASPATGTHAQGDIAWNVAPIAAGFAGWICTVGGTPGTWKTFGVISA